MQRRHDFELQLFVVPDPYTTLMPDNTLLQCES
jgi:hypothetical protein